MLESVIAIVVIGGIGYFIYTRILKSKNAGPGNTSGTIRRKGDPNKLK